MGKLDIRNAGFERGNLDFWQAYDDGLLSIYDTDQVYGSYSGRCEYGSGAMDGLLTSDYLEASEGEIIKIAGHIRPSAGRWGGLRVIEYDGDYSLIHEGNLTWLDIPAAWTYIDGFYAVPPEVEFIRMGFINGGLSAGGSLLVDSVSALRIDKTYIRPMVRDVRSFAALTVTDSTSGSPVDLLGCDKYFMDINYAVGSGSAAGIQIDVYEADSYLTGGYLVGAHTIANSTVSERTRIALSSAVGAGLYVNITVDTPAPLSSYLGLTLIGSRG